jgi:hypothetical protein
MADNVRAPIDTNVKIPPAVLRNSAAATAAHERHYQAAPPDPNAPPLTPDPAPVAPATPPESLDEGSWENRYKAMKGRHDKNLLTIEQQQGTIASQGQRLASLEGMLANMSAPAPVAPVAPVNNELDAAAMMRDRETFGDDFMGAVERQARALIKPELDARDAKIADLTQQLGGVASHVAGDARQKMIERLDHEVPKWREQNVDGAFLAWLRLQDPFSGAIRSSLLKTAFDQNQADRVLAFFKGFLTEEATVAPAAPAAPAPNSGGRPSLEDLAAPGRAKSAAAAPSGSPEKPIITRAQITQFYSDVASGKYAGNDAKKASDEAMIFEAEREGRIR